MDSESPLSCQALRKTFRLGRSELEIINGLDASFPWAGLTTIQGASGSGKSTLLQILGGLERPDSGEVLWKHQSVYARSRGELAEWRRLTVGFVFQAYHLLPELSALENVDLPARFARSGNEKESAKLLEQVGLGARLKHRPAELSGGEQQRVAIARAMRNGPQLLLADEPTGNLDAKSGREIIDLLLELQQESACCLIIVTHDSSIAALGQQRYRMESGRLSAA